MDKKKKVLLLDRDGIINTHIEGKYVGVPEKFVFIPEIFDLCQSAQENGYEIIVITNQAGLAKAKFKFDEFLKTTKKMILGFKERNINIKAIYFCPYHENAKEELPEYLINKELQTEEKISQKAELICCIGNNCSLYQSQYRKPHGGMILQAIEKYPIDIENSIFIGDKLSDMKAAIFAGVLNNILISKNYTQKDLNSLQKRVKNLEKLPKNISELLNT